jgi:hypothetical protein
MAIIQGRQQQTAMPITHARATQNTTKKTSNARKTMESLQGESYIRKQSKIIRNIALFACQSYLRHTSKVEERLLTRLDHLQIPNRIQ